MSTDIELYIDNFTSRATLNCGSERKRNPKTVRYE
jgi:hypothetical protein